MRTFYKSFTGALAGSLVVLIAFLFLFPKLSHQSYKLAERPIQQVDARQSMPVHAASYPIAQEADFINAAEKSIHAVVHIKTEIRVRTISYENFFNPFRDYFGDQNRNNTYMAFGSGVIISSDGYIVTNNHVVEGADKISVTLNNKQELEAEIIGRDPSTDLALIKVEAKNLDFLTYGDSDKVKIGEWVLAVGNPFNLNSTVTAGIVSAKARNINILGAQSSIESFIQTDAVVNRGNSGGALVNTRGDLIGINAAIASHTGVYEGYSFAIPVNIVKKVVNDLQQYGEIQRAYLGVQIRDINAEFASEIGLDEVRGVYVASVVENAGADDAGIKEGDIIRMIDETNINSLSELMGTVSQYSPGEQVKVHVLRDNKSLVFNVTLKNQNGTTAIVKTQDAFYNELLGASFQKIDKSELNDLSIKHGLRITNIEDGILQRGGITQGFIITEINEQAVYSKQSLQDAISQTRRHTIRLKGLFPNGVRVSYEFML